MDRIDLNWPSRWQPEAIGAVRPYVGADVRLEILVDDPATAVSGTLVAGYVYSGQDGSVMVIHDHSGRPDVYPWKLFSGPVLRVSLLRPRRRKLDLYVHPVWKARLGLR
jgi:hypothetical protein